MQRYDDRPVRTDRNSFGYGHTRLEHDGKRGTVRGAVLRLALGVVATRLVAAVS